MRDPLARLNRRLARVGVDLGGDAPVRLSDEERQSVLRDLGYGALSAVETAGNVLDTPGAVVRNLLTGNNALAPIGSPLTGEGRVSGRDVLEKAGLLSANTPGLDLGDVLGFGTEIALDPLTYATLGFSALGKGGKIAKAAGLLGKVEKVAPQAGKRVGLMTTNLRDLLAVSSPKEVRAAARAAKASGQKLSKIADAPLGGIGSLGLPFREPSVVFSGPVSQRIGRRLDTAGEALRYGNVPGTGYSPGRHLSALFSSPSKGALTTLGQKAAQQLHVEEEAIRSGAAQEAFDRLRDLNDRGLATPDQQRAFREALEGWSGPNSAFQPVADPIKSDLERLIQQEKPLGLARDEYKDPWGNNYFPARLLEPEEGASRTASRVFETRDPSQSLREDLFKGWSGGRSTIMQMAEDPNIGGMNRLLPDDKAAAKYIRANFGTFVHPDHAKKFKKENKKSIYSAMANWLGELAPDIAQKGAFVDAPLTDYMRRRIGGERSVAAANKVIDLLSETVMPHGLYGIETIPVRDVLQRAGMNLGNKGNPGALHTLTAAIQSKGKNLGLKDVRKAVVPRDIADDIGRLMNKFDLPEPVSMLTKGVDSLTSLFKAGVLTHPARYSRDFTSGAVQNLLTGLVRPLGLPSAMKAANQIATGKTVKGAAKIPIIADELRRLGRSGDEEGTRLLRELAAAHEVTSGGQIEDVVQNVPKFETNADLEGMLPGSTPFSWRKVGRTLIPKSLEEANPRNVRGFNGRKESAFAPVAAGDMIGDWTDAMNRLTPWIDQLKRGIDPAVAARDVKGAQVDYSPRAFTSFEQNPRNLMAPTRLIPFYKFTRKMVPYTAQQLASNPAGPLGQLIRGQRIASDQDTFLPSHARESSAIPLETLPDGTRRILTGLGLMHEAPFNFVGTPKEAGLQLLAGLNPLIKGPLELSTGQSFFQRGPQGGRPIEDLDPTIGRILSNVQSLATGERGLEPYRVPGGLYTEQLAANSPLSRLLSTIRTVTDPRKYEGDLPGVGLATNLLTGARVTDVSPDSQQQTLREYIGEAERELGGRRAERIYIPKEILARMSPENQRTAKQLLALNAELERAARLRSKQRKIEKQQKK